MEIPVNNNFKCTMCFFKCTSHEEFMQHYTRNHKHDPQFRVQCNLCECGATFNKWRSFRTHLFRRHPQIPLIENEIVENFIEQATINRHDLDEIMNHPNNDEGNLII